MDCFLFHFVLKRRSKGSPCCLAHCCGIFVGRGLYTTCTINITAVAYARHLTASGQRPITASTGIIIAHLGVVTQIFKLLLLICIPLDVDAININAPHLICTASAIPTLISPHSHLPTHRLRTDANNQTAVPYKQRWQSPRCLHIPTARLFIVIINRRRRRQRFITHPGG